MNKRALMSVQVIDFYLDYFNNYLTVEKIAEHHGLEDHAEYNTNGWHDSYMYAGNASEPFWTEYLWIKLASERKEVA